MSSNVRPWWPALKHHCLWSSRLIRLQEDPNIRRRWCLYFGNLSVCHPRLRELCPSVWATSNTAYRCSNSASCHSAPISSQLFSAESARTRILQWYKYSLFFPPSSHLSCQYTVSTTNRPSLYIRAPGVYVSLFVQSTLHFGPGFFITFFRLCWKNHGSPVLRRFPNVLSPRGSKTI